MKKYIFSGCLFIITCFSAKAQFNYRNFSATLNAGAGRGYMDAADEDFNVNLGISAEYNFSPFSYFSLGVNNGKFSKSVPDQYGRGFESNLTTVTGMINMSFGEITQPNWKYTRGFFDNIYVGAGIGVVQSKMKDFNNVGIQGRPGYPAPIGGVKYSGTNLIIPINVGLNVKFFDSFKELKPVSLNINYQHNFSLTDNIDGYSPTYDNKFSDAFSIFTIGLRYSFGSDQNYSSYR